VNKASDRITLETFTTEGGLGETLAASVAAWAPESEMSSKSTVNGVLWDTATYVGEGLVYLPSNLLTAVLGPLEKPPPNVSDIEFRSSVMQEYVIPPDSPSYGADITLAPST